MKALMSYTSSVLEWLGRSVGLLVFGLLFVTALLIRTTMMTGYFEWAEISSVPWYVYVSGGVILLLTLLWFSHNIFTILVVQFMELLLSVFI